MKNIFEEAVTNEIIDRINQLTPESQPQWGKMNVAQMLAHCNVTYELVYDNKHPKPGAFKRWILTLMVKNTVVNEKPYRKNSPTSPEFNIVDERQFTLEKDRLTAYIKRAQQDGAAFYDGRESHSFGPLNATEWNNMFYKHLEHHLTQFGV